MSISTFNKVAIVMGEGDVLTGMAIEPGGVGAFTFAQADKAMPVGTKVPELDGTPVSDADVVILFSDIAAVDNMINRLGELRALMVEGGAA